MDEKELETWQLEAEAELAFHNTQVMLEKRWKKQGRQEEQERIIKLLEAESRCKDNEHDYNGYCYCEEIALIKGENK